jgi:hypothetical protein
MIGKLLNKTILNKIYVINVNTIALCSNQYAAPFIYPGQHVKYEVHYINTNQRKAMV